MVNHAQEIELTAEQKARLAAGKVVFVDADYKSVKLDGAESISNKTKVNYPALKMSDGLKFAVVLTALFSPVLIGLAIVMGGAMACVWMLTH